MCLFLTVLDPGKFTIKVLTYFFLKRVLLQMAIFSLCLYMAGAGVELNCLMTLLIRWSPPLVMTLSKPSYFPKTPTSNAITFRGTRFIHSSMLSSILFLILGVSLPTRLMSPLSHIYAINLTEPKEKSCLSLEFGINSSIWLINPRSGPLPWSLSSIKLVFWTYCTFCSSINHYHQFSLPHIENCECLWPYAPIEQRI